MSKKEYLAEYYKKNRERIKAQVAKYRAENPEKVKEAVRKCWSDPEKSAKYKEQHREWYKKSGHSTIAVKRAADWLKQRPDRFSIVNAKSVAYKTGKIRRKPCWLTETDLWMIKEAYRLAELRTRLTGVKWHVDHIIPLRGKRVSGLHVPTNLRVITASENHRKSNHFAEVT